MMLFLQMSCLIKFHMDFMSYKIFRGEAKVSEESLSRDEMLRQTSHKIFLYHMLLVNFDFQFYELSSF